MLNSWWGEAKSGFVVSQMNWHTPAWCSGKPACTYESMRVTCMHWSWCALLGATGEYLSKDRFGLLHLVQCWVIGFTDHLSLSHFKVSFAPGTGLPSLSTFRLSPIVSRCYLWWLSHCPLCTAYCPLCLPVWVSALLCSFLLMFACLLHPIASHLSCIYTIVFSGWTLPPSLSQLLWITWSLLAQ